MRQNDNLIKTVSRLLTLLKVNVTRTSIEKLKLHPQYPNLQCLSESLKEWHINSLGAKLTSQQLHEIPYPAIAHLNKKGGHYVVLEKIEKDRVYYFDSDTGTTDEPVSDFEKKWFGVALLVEKTFHSGEINFDKNQKNEVFQKLSNQLTIGLSVVLLTIAFAYIPTSIWVVYSLKIFGSAICVLLLHSQFGSTNPLLSSICGKNSKSDCNAVIHSKYSKLFGTVNLSEVASLYFFGCLTLLTLSAISNINVISIIYVLSILAMPLTLLSIWYQWVVLKTWCRLCLAIVGILWLDFTILFWTFSSWSFSPEILYITLLSFCIPLIFWLPVRHRYIESLRINELEKRLFRFTKSEHSFQTLLKSQPSVEHQEFTKELSTGNKNAALSIILVTSPVCRPCFYAHKIVDEMQKIYKNDINVIYRFLIPQDKKSLPFKIAEHLAGKLMTDSKHEVLTALHRWYSLEGEIGLNKWLKEFPARPHSSEGRQSLLLEHSLWCTRAGIYSTPTIFINGKKLPEEFSVADLPFQLQKLMEQPAIVTESNS